MSGVEVIISTFTDGSLRPEVYFAAFFDEEEKFTRHLVDEFHRTACGKSVWAKPRGISGLCGPNEIDCPGCRQLLAGARFAFAPAMLAVAS